MRIDQCLGTAFSLAAQSGNHHLTPLPVLHLTSLHFTLLTLLYFTLLTSLHSSLLHFTSLCGLEAIICKPNSPHKRNCKTSYHTLSALLNRVSSGLAMSGDPLMPLPEASRRWRTKTPSILGRDDLYNSSGSGSPGRNERKGFAKYLSSYLSAANTPTSPKTGSPREDFWTKIDPHEYFDTTDPLDTLDCLSKRLVNEPYRPLDASANSLLLRIFEAYRKLSEKNVQLTSSFEKALETLEEAGKMWAEESNKYQAEIRGLNILGAKENRGLMGRIATRKEISQRKGSIDVTSPISNQGTFSSISSEGSTRSAPPCPGK